MKLVESKGRLVKDHAKGKLIPEDYYHGLHRKLKDLTKSHERYFYIVIPQLGWNPFNFMIEDDKALFLKGKEYEINWHKYDKEFNDTNKRFSDEWKFFNDLNKDIFSKYKVESCETVMKLKHCSEGRSPTYIIIENDAEFKQLLDDMKYINIDISDFEDFE